MCPFFTAMPSASSIASQPCPLQLLLQGIVHYDIKTDNLLVFEDEDGNLNAKLSDFG